MRLLGIDFFVAINALLGLEFNMKLVLMFRRILLSLKALLAFQTFENSILRFLNEDYCASRDED